MSSQISILAGAILAIHNGTELSADVLAKLNEFATALSADDMMMPVDAAPKPVKAPKAPKPVAPVMVASAPPGTFGPTDDVLRAHPSRLQAVNFGLCMARKIDEERVVPGTNKGEAGANGKVFYEKQCSKAPLPGGKLCKICDKKESEASGDQKIKGWYGRLDDAAFYKWAYVVGCPWYVENYPKGIAGDAATTGAKPVATVVAPAAPEPAAAPAPTTVPEKKKGGRKAKTAEPAATKESTAPESVAVDAPVKTVEWVMGTWTNSAGVSRPIVRNIKNNNVYEYNTESLLIEDAALREQYIGQWESGTLNEYAEEVTE